ncbi:MAG: GerW family sporulation protein, partial [Clostridia bacterium]|nr:GerW family sporulation protein [Clostridia bacterium]
VAFLVIKDGEVSLKHITANDNAAERIVNMIPDVIDKVSGIAQKFKGGDAEAVPEEE